MHADISSQVFCAHEFWFFFSTKGTLQDEIMGITVDDVMEKIGSYNRFQYRLLLICGFIKTWSDGLQMMLPTFLSVEPPWRCKANSSACNLTGIFKPGDENYNYRCSIPRDVWEFDTSDFTSTVAEVGTINSVWIQRHSPRFSRARAEDCGSVSLIHL